MLVNSIVFWIFFFVVLIPYFSILRKNTRNDSGLNGKWIKSNKDLTCFYGASKAVTKVLDRDVMKGFDHLKMLSNLYRYNNTLEWLATAHLSNWGEGVSTTG